jgi:hypothetical protein
MRNIRASPTISIAATPATVTASHTYTAAGSLSRDQSVEHGRRGGLVVGHFGALPPAPQPSTATSRCWCTAQSADTRSVGTFGGLGRVLQMVNGAQYRVEVVAVTAVPPSTVTCIADGDDAPATPPRHPPARGGAVHSGGTVAGSRKGLASPPPVISHARATPLCPPVSRRRVGSRLRRTLATHWAVWPCLPRQPETPSRPSVRLASPPSLSSAVPRVGGGSAVRPGR